MRRIFILLLLLPLFFCSCKNLYFKTDNLAQIKSKTSMAPFVHLNDPIVPLIYVEDKYSLFGNPNLSSYYTTCGEIFVVYDWENEEVYDWAYCDGIIGNWYSKAAEIGEPTNYYVAGYSCNLIGELSSETGKVSLIPTDVRGTFKSLTNNVRPRTKYGIIDGPGLLNGGYGSFGFYIFDSEKKELNSNGLLQATEHPGYLFFPFSDKTGNYWYSYTDNQKNWLVKIDCEQNTMSEPIFLSNVNKDKEFEVLDICLVTKDYVLLSSSIYSNYPHYLYVYDKVNDNYKKVIIPKDSKNESLCLYMACEISDEIYAVTYGGDGEFIYKLDTENLRFDLLIKYHGVFNDTIYVRGSRIYFLKTTGKSFSVSYYDTKFGSQLDENGRYKGLSDIKTYTFEDVVKF